MLYQASGGGPSSQAVASCRTLASCDIRAAFCCQGPPARVTGRQVFVPWSLCCVVSTPRPAVSKPSSKCAGNRATADNHRFGDIRPDFAEAHHEAARRTAPAAAGTAAARGAAATSGAARQLTAPWWRRRAAPAPPLQRRPRNLRTNTRQASGANTSYGCAAGAKECQGWCLTAATASICLRTSCNTQFAGPTRRSPPFFSMTSMKTWCSCAMQPAAGMGDSRSHSPAAAARCSHATQATTCGEGLTA